MGRVGDLLVGQTGARLYARPVGFSAYLLRPECSLAYLVWRPNNLWLPKKWITSPLSKA